MMANLERRTFLVNGIAMTTNLALGLPTATSQTSNVVSEVPLHSMRWHILKELVQGKSKNGKKTSYDPRWPRTPDAPSKVTGYSDWMKAYGHQFGIELQTAYNPSGKIIIGTCMTFFSTIAAWHSPGQDGETTFQEVGIDKVSVHSTISLGMFPLLFDPLKEFTNSNNHPLWPSVSQYSYSLYRGVIKALYHVHKGEAIEQRDIKGLDGIAQDIYRVTGVKPQQIKPDT